jgi:hypothetical protein
VEEGFDGESAQEAEGPTGSELDPAKLQRELEKVRKEAMTARLELRRAQLEKEYGTEIVELIPEALPQTEWGDFAEKLQTFRGQTPPEPQIQTEQATEPVVQETLSPQEQAIAAVAKGSEGISSPSAGMSPEEALVLAKNNPEEYLRLKKTGAVSLERLPGNL